MDHQRHFAVIYDDPHLVVVAKSPGLLTVPTARGETQTLVQRLRHHLGRGRAFAPRLEVVHRLDRDVSGVLVFAKSARVAEALREAFAAHRPEREYVALVVGNPPAAGRFASRLVTGKSLQRYSTRDPAAGEDAITHYAVEKVLAGAALVRVRLETGRRNQIRVHFAEAGHPILGDPRYRPELARHPRWPHRWLALHARLLGFTHPVTGEALRFEAAPPPEFAQFLRAAGPGRPNPRQAKTTARPLATPGRADPRQPAQPPPGKTTTRRTGGSRPTPTPAPSSRRRKPEQGSRPCTGRPSRRH